MALTDKLSAIGEAIRSKTGGTELLTLDEMPTAIEGIETGGSGDTTNEDGLITGTLTEYTNDRVKSVKDYAFYNGALTSATFLLAETVGERAFMSCAKLKEIEMPKVKTMGQNALAGCKELHHVYTPLLETTGNYCFQNCKKLETVVLPELKSIGMYTFNYCDKLTTVSVPNLETLTQSAFSSCYALRHIDFPSLTSFSGQYGLQLCQNLKSVVLRSETSCTLMNINVFSGSPFAAGKTGGVVLVPTALAENYQTATNWSTLYATGTCTFLPLEEYTMDGTTTGEIDMEKVEAKLNELYGGATA